MGHTKNILVITTWSFNDGLIQSSTLPYLKLIHQISPSSSIYLVTQENNKQAVNQTNLENEPYLRLVPQQYYKFGLIKLLTSLLQFLNLWWIIIRNNISHIHCFCTPAGATGYLLAKLSGRKLVLDSYEPHAESMVENGTWTRNGWAFKILWWFERKQTEVAHFCIGATKAMKSYASEKYHLQITNYGVRPTCVDLEKFTFNDNIRKSLRQELRWEKKIVCVYAGKFGGIYLDKEVFDFFKVAYDLWGDQFRILLLSGITVEELDRWCVQTSLPKTIIHAKSVPFAVIQNYLAVADFAITPVKPVPSKRYCSPIKNGEYWAMGLPVVITKNISDDSEIILQNDIGAVIEELNRSGYLEAIKKIDQLLWKNNNIQLREKIREVAYSYRNYSIANSEYEKVYASEKM